jgi:hypothetical protein
MVRPISQNIPSVSQAEREDQFKILNSNALDKRVSDVCNENLCKTFRVDDCGCDGDCGCDMEDDCSCDTNEGCGNEGADAVMSNPIMMNRMYI